MMRRILPYILSVAALFTLPLLIMAATWGTWNGATVGGASTNLSKLHGLTIGTAAGNLGSWNGLTSPGGAGCTGICDAGTCFDATCRLGVTETGKSGAPVGNTTTTVTTGTLTIAPGATLEVVIVGSGAVGAAGAWTISSALGNSFQCSPAAGVGAPLPAICYAYNHSGSALATGPETVTVSWTGPWYPSVLLKAYSGTLTTASVLDGNPMAATGKTCASVTFAAANELDVCGIYTTDSGPYTIGSSYIGASVVFAGSVNYGNGYGWVLQTGSGPVAGPTWTTGCSSPCVGSTIRAAFKHP